MIMSIFPIVVNVATGLLRLNRNSKTLCAHCARASSISPWNVGLPRTMPYFFASLKVAVTLAFVGTVISETVASNRGIGNVMMIASSNFDVPLVFAGLLILAVMGVALYAIFSLTRIPHHRVGASQRRICDGLLSARAMEHHVKVDFWKHYMRTLADVHQLGDVHVSCDAAKSISVGWGQAAQPHYKAYHFA